MKKTFVMALAALAVAGTLTLSSCGGEKSNADLINEYKELLDEGLQAAKDGDASKSEEIQKKAEALKDEMKGREFTQEEQQEVLKITAEAAKKAFAQ